MKKSLICVIGDHRSVQFGKEERWGNPIASATIRRLVCNTIVVKNTGADARSDSLAKCSERLKGIKIKLPPSKVRFFPVRPCSCLCFTSANQFQILMTTALTMRVTGSNMIFNNVGLLIPAVIGYGGKSPTISFSGPLLAVRQPTQPSNVKAQDSKGK